MTPSFPTLLSSDLFPLRDSNYIQMLAGGDQAYPAMIAAIDGARKTIGLQTYIFDDDPEGRKFVEALVRAEARGVEIRILIDAICSKYSRPPIIHRLPHITDSRRHGQTGSMPLQTQV